MPDFIVPIAMLTLVTMVVFLVLQQRRNDRLRGQGRCLHCGYDLRASEQRCPECGHSIQVKAPHDSESGLFDDVFATQPISPRIPGVEERLIPVLATSQPIEANFLVQLLEHRGITAILDGSPRPTDYQPVKLRVMVWSGDEDSAMHWVAELARRQQARAVARRVADSAEED